MREEVHLHRKVVGSLNLGCLPTYLSQVFFLEGVQSIVNRGSIRLDEWCVRSSSSSSSNT